MEIIFHNKFLKLYRKTPLKVQEKFEECITLFHKNPFDQKLRNHSLLGIWSSFRSIDITGDWRVIYRQQNKAVAEFYAIGKHGQLYK